MHASNDRMIIKTDPDKVVLTVKMSVCWDNDDLRECSFLPVGDGEVVNL